MSRLELHHWVADMVSGERLRSGMGDHLRDETASWVQVGRSVLCQRWRDVLIANDGDILVLDNLGEDCGLA